MPTLHQHTLSRRGFCLCCMVAATFTATGTWLSPSLAYAEARNIVDLIRDDAAKAPIKVHRLRGDVSILEGSGGNIAVLTGADGKVFIDAGITASRPRILEAANGLSRDPIRHLINTHWHFDHTDGNQWLNAEGVSILAHENTRKHLLVSQRVEDWDYNFLPLAAGGIPSEVFAGEHSLKLNGTSIGTLQTVIDTGKWNQFAGSWSSESASSVTISIIDRNINFAGNDFALDDISFNQVIGPSETAPEPSTFVLLGIGAAGSLLGYLRRRKVVANVN